MRLDRFLGRRGFRRRDIQQMLASGRVQVDGEVVGETRAPVGRFSAVSLDGNVLQANVARYFMLHKPVGCLSATRDPTHRTVFDLLDVDDPDELHIGGRLDFNTTGLLLITNDGGWSRRMTDPARKLAKVYRVVTEAPIGADVVTRFASGIPFRYEGITTRPAILHRLAPCEARLTLFEGRYHQVKRMFGYFDNRVLALHRESMGSIVLDASLAPGEYRCLSPREIAAAGPAPSGRL